MWVLGIDTAGLTQAVALVGSNGQCLVRRTAERRQQGEIVQGFVRECLAEAGIGLRDLSGIAAISGPGSFTGLRIGLAMAQGYGRALGCPIAGYSRFTLLRPLSPDAVIVLDSLRDELFVQFSPEITEMLPVAAILPRLDGRPVLGDGVAHLDMPPLEHAPEAELAARKLLADLAAGLPLPPAAPLYVRPPDVTFPKAVS